MLILAICLIIVALAAASIYYRTDDTDDYIYHDHIFNDYTID